MYIKKRYTHHDRVFPMQRRDIAATIALQVHPTIMVLTGGMANRFAER